MSTAYVDDELEANRETKTIGELGRQFGLTPRALRFYEGKGLLRPLRRGTARHYRSHDVKKVETIVALRRFGFTVTEIAGLLRAEYRDRAYPLTAEQCRKQLALLRDHLKQTQSAIDELSDFEATLPGP